MNQGVTNSGLLDDMRTLNQEHVPNGYPCVQTWQIDRLIWMIDLRDEKLAAVQDALARRVAEDIRRAESADEVALNIVLAWKGRTFVCETQAMANLQVMIAAALRGDNNDAACA